MRIILPVAMSLACCAASFAPEGAGPRPAGSRLPLNDARTFAMQLNRVIEMTTAQYVRPVARADLVRAALAGLYEAARTPLPASFEAELDRIQREAELIDWIDETSISVIARLPPEQQNAAVRAVLLMREANNAARLGLFIRAREQLGDVEALRGHEALLEATRGMLKLLDPYCGLASAREFMRGSADEAAPGFGVELNANLGAGPLAVKAVVPGGPAQKAGLRPGDRITHIAGVQVNRVTSAPPGSPAGDVAARADALLRAILHTVASRGVVLTVERDGSPPFPIRFNRGVFKGETVLGVMRNDDNTWDYWIDRQHKIAQVRIASLAAGTSEDLAQVLTELQAQGLKGLVLDLRWCPGGLLPEAIQVALLFVGSRRVATVKGRDGRELEYSMVGEVPAGRRSAFAKVGLVVLVNGATSGGAELIAAAIQDNQRGRIAGQRTLGKASVQTAFDLVENTKLKISTGTFFRPSGKNLHRFKDSKESDDWGVRPDDGLELRISPDMTRQLRSWWQLQTLRPGKSRAALPLDDPATDTQRQTAVELLIQEEEVKKD